eukprot:TRINITY_DN4556_c0_g1_i2.p1 TRINITY_DN4556_c0_g1~~TRINITY_DN4556_c0_g1_i2.p1  ORF type:complete len:471 (+),score=148.40 TRINITY_DN4556_c0_g1_i2:28-1440(+)
MAQVVTILLGVLAVASAVDLRGVRPSEQSKYQGSHFTCENNGKNLPISAVNDDYCDCSDGSDEPGTSACSNGVFYCQNEGHRPELLLSSRVNDGLCDCCDGSDEYNGLSTCSNTCDEAGEQARAAARAAHELRTEGYKKRLELQANGQAQHQDREARLATLESEISRLQSEYDTLKAEKEAAELPERDAKDAFDKQWEETKQQRSAQAHADTFATLDKDGNQVLTVDDLVHFTQLDADEDGAVSPEEAGDILDIDGDGALNETESAMDLEQFKEHAYDTVLDQMPDVEGVVRAEHGDKPDYDEDIKALITAADEARSKYTEVESNKRNLEDEKAKVTKHIGADVGADKEFASMVDQCYELVDREYKYRLCMFDRITQEPKNGGRQTRLGDWKGFVGPADDKYSMLDYSGGEKCWNGPQRSCKVTLECGIDHEVVSVVEPNRCEYAMRFKTPAACKQPPSTIDDLISHDEL